MRKIVAGLFITLDGVVEIPEEWMGPYFTPELGQAIGAMMGAQDAMLLGRVTYEMFAAHWPNQAGDMADTMNGTPKYVVSGTLESADWQNTTLIPAAGAFELFAIENHIMIIDQAYHVFCSLFIRKRGHILIEIPEPFIYRSVSNIKCALCNLRDSQRAFY